MVAMGQPVTEPQIWVVILPYTKPPLTLNGGTGNRYARANAIRTIRRASMLHARAAGVPRLQHAKVTLEYQPRATRRSDSLNIAPTLKAAVDGLVDLGVLPDDDDAHCEQTPRVLPKGPQFNAEGHRLRLVIEGVM